MVALCEASVARRLLCYDSRRGWLTGSYKGVPRRSCNVHGNVGFSADIDISCLAVFYFIITTLLYLYLYYLASGCLGSAWSVQKPDLAQRTQPE